MPITARCECGKRTSVADSLSGAMIRCSSCGRDVQVGAAPPSAGGSAPASKPTSRPGTANPIGRRNPEAVPAISISPALVISAIVAVVVIAIVLSLYFGPWTVGNQWAAMSPRANNDVTDVVNFAIQAYESEHGMYDAAQSHVVPRVDGDAAFVPPMMAFTMPRRIIFTGKTNQGNYMGTYDTTDGEVAVDIEVGGMTVGGLVDVRKATGTFHTTGREKDGKVEAEADGHPLQIIMRKTEK